MGATRIQTADKNSLIIHMTPVYQLMSYELKICMFVRNKSIILSQLKKYKSKIHNKVPQVKRSIPFYIYAFSRRFYPKRLTVHSGYTYYFVSMFVLWELNPKPFALLTQCSTTEPQEHLLSLSHEYPLTYLIKTILDCFISCSWFVQIFLSRFKWEHF